MRKITLEVCKALLAGKAKRLGNTETDGTHLYLHGNLIALRNDCGDYVGSLAGWPTSTTRERLNGLCSLLDGGGRFYQRRGEQRFSQQGHDVAIDDRQFVFLAKSPA